ncbi:MAG: protein kinase [Myxococcota bacterium]
MSTGPAQPIPEATQPYVDRLVGARVGEHRVEGRVTEGRFGTIYRGVHVGSGRPVTIQVLRVGVSGHDEEVRAATATRSPGVVAVVASGEVPDGRRYRVMEPLEGESLAQRLERDGKRPPGEVVALLAKVAKVLETTHAWAVAHGSLTASSVYLSGDAVRLIDFGLAKERATVEGDLQALGALGFTLLTGEELREGAPPPLGAGIPELLDRLLRELLEKRLASATEARKELEGLTGLVDEAPAPSVAAGGPRTRSRGLVVALALGLVAVTAGGVFVLRERAEADAAAAIDYDDALDDLDLPPEGSEEVADDATTPSEPVATEPVGPAPTATPSTPRPPKRVHRAPRPVPSAQALQAQISKLEGRLRKQAKAGADLDQALYVLNKQRLRLTGSPTEQDRRDVVRQLAGWQRSYLRH